MSEPGKEVRDIGYPKPPKKRPSFAPRTQEDMPPRARFGPGAFLGVGLAALLICGAYVFFSARRAGMHVPSPQGSFASFLEDLKNKAADYGDLQGVSTGALNLLNLSNEARRIIPGFLSGQSVPLADFLRSARTELENLITNLDKIAAGNSSLKNQLPFFSEYLALRPDLDTGRGLLDGLIALLGDGAEHHIILVLGNTSELRPGGGFIGSFADLDIASGTLRSVEVRDINEVDNTRGALVIPPKPLQAIAGSWRTADANWFLDFPASARKTLEFMSESSLYATSTLDGMIAVTPKAVGDMLAITGPVSLPDGRTISADNLVGVIQKDVQAGQAAGSAAPKAVLGELAGPLRAKLAALSSDEQDALLKYAQDWLKHKDLMIYMRDERMAKALAAYGADGGLYSLNSGLEGDYLAVADANIGGGKTDLYIQQKVSLESRIDPDGTVHNDLSVERKHNGDKAAEWWYKVPNWNYLQIFTPGGAVLEDVKGAGLRNITPKADYRKGYSADPDIKQVEDSLINSADRKLQVFTESGRNVFGTWQKIDPGLTKTFEIKYSRRLPVPLGPGDRYTFILESQAGAQSSFDLLLSAPVGFIWKENGLPIYEYKSDNPPGRFIKELTLVKP